MNFLLLWILKDSLVTLKKINRNILFIFNSQVSDKIIILHLSTLVTFQYGHICHKAIEIKMKETLTLIWFDIPKMWPSASSLDIIAENCHKDKKMDEISLKESVVTFLSIIGLIRGSTEKFSA